MTDILVFGLIKVAGKTDMLVVYCLEVPVIVDLSMAVVVV